MLVNVHRSYRWVVAVCDSDLAGKKFEDDMAQVDLGGDFFKGEEKNKEETKEIIFDAQKEDATFFVVGEESVSLVKEMGLVEDEGVRDVGGVPVALILL